MLDIALNLLYLEHTHAEHQSDRLVQNFDLTGETEQQSSILFYLVITH
jgi:hypothetical protein